VTKVFYLKYASVSTSRLTNEVISNIGGTQASSSGGPAEGGGGGGTEQEKGTITQVLQKILTKNGTVTEDYRTNSLIVNDIPSRMPIVAQTIAAIDVPVSEVMLEVEMLDVSKNVVDKMGFKFGSTPFSVLITGAQATTGFPFHNWSKVFSADKTGTIDINNAASGSTYAMQLDFLRTLTDTKYLARPKILTLNNQTAEIKITTNETVGLAESTAGQTTGVVAYNAERVETGVTLRVTPQINLETNDITMFIMPTVKDVNTSSYPVKNLAGNYYKDPEERSTKSIVRVRDGETIILGGLLRNQKSTVVTKLPILGDLPVLGALFRHRAQDPGRERELLVFITPHIVKETSIELAKAKKVVLPMREQDTASGADREALISSSLNSFEKKKK
jgi:type II secretory pathway component GspD/PulD (secretin)